MAFGWTQCDNCKGCGATTTTQPTVPWIEYTPPIPGMLDGYGPPLEKRKVCSKCGGMGRIEKYRVGGPVRKDRPR